ncbi:hypothetical protein HZB60_08200 [candidate division KSB1 bacterium]|nr:hypothetical protein [candidate division KSB1 bacterium]
METPVHSEAQRTYDWMWIVFTISSLVLILTWGLKLPEPGRYFTVGGLLLIALFLWGFLELRVVITMSEVRFGFPFWRKRFPLKAVSVGDVVQLTVWNGIGIHRVARGWVFNARFGRAVEIFAGGVRYLIGSNDPERLQAALLRAAPRRGRA